MDREQSKQSVVESVKLLPEQIISSWEYVSAMPVPQQFHNAKQMVVAGMGGSALGGRVMKHYGKSYIPIPIEVVCHYTLPEYVDEDTLVIVSSYSGSTEETISCLEDALDKKAMVFVITSGGQLAEEAKKEGLPSYVFQPEHNPSNQPRMATGYSLGALLALMSSLNFLHLDESELRVATTIMRERLEEYGNPDSVAHKFAKQMYERIPVLVASEHLLGSVHIFKNQLNESAKCFSMSFDMPELNHHLMEGLVNPSGNENLLFMMFESELYHPRVQKRYPLTMEIIEKNNREVVTHKLQSETRLQQVFEMLALGSYIELYLADLYQSDPIEIPWVEYFKEQMS